MEKSFYKCPYCDYGYAKHDDLCRHVNFDHRYSCVDLNCKCTFKFMLDRDRHYIFTHTNGANNIKCWKEGCYYIAVNDDDFQCHIQTTHIMDDLGITKELQDIDAMFDKKT